METECNDRMKQYLVRRTAYGLVSGTKESGALAWYNIPYGKEPSGALGWQPPQECDPWEGVYDASWRREPAMQPSEDWTGVIGTMDCLNLDVYSLKDAENLPVLVFLHGGNNQTGTSLELVGTDLAAKDGMVVVSVNHRVGLFGFNCLPALMTEESRSGNFALLDIALALDWVKANIAQFGGDPDCITLCGFSAGGRNVTATLISPLFAGKYHRAVVFSGGLTTADQELSAGKTARFLARLVVEDGIKATEQEAVRWLLCQEQRLYNGETEQEDHQNSSNNVQKEDVKKYLYSLAPERVAGLVGGAGIRMSSFPHLFADGEVLPKEGFDTENYNDVPVMMVTGMTEFSMFALGDPFLLSPQMMEYSARYRLRAAKFASRYGSRMYRYFNTDASAQKMSAHAVSPLYLGAINFGHEDSAYPIRNMGSFHGIFLAMLYPETNAAENAPDGMFTEPAYIDMASKFRTYLKRFMLTGDPNASESMDRESESIADIRKKKENQSGVAGGELQNRIEGESSASETKWPAWSRDHAVSLVFDGKEDCGTTECRIFEDSWEKIMEDMEQDTSIAEDLKLLVIRNILNGRWFSEPFDRRYHAENLWEQ